MTHPSYLGHYFQVEIYDPQEGTVFEMRHPEFPFVSGITIEDVGKDGGADVISISIDAPFIEGRKLLSSRIFAVNNGITARIGYQGGKVSRTFFGWLNNGGVGLTLTPDGLSGTITAQSQGPGVFSKNYLKNERSTLETYKGAIRSFGFTPYFTDGALAAIREIEGYPVIGMKSAQEVLDEINAVANLRMTHLIENGAYTTFVAAEAEIASKKPKRKFLMNGAISENVYPIIGFTPNLDAKFFALVDAPGSKSVRTGDISDAGDQREEVAKKSESQIQSGTGVKFGTITGDLEASAKAGEGLQEVEKIKDDSNETTPDYVYIPGDNGEQLRKAHLRNLRDQVGRGDTWQAQLDTVGIPDIEPFEIIEIPAEGVGSLFGGNYLIEKVIHQSSGGDYSMSLELVSRLGDSSAGTNDAEADAT